MSVRVCSTIQAGVHRNRGRRARHRRSCKHIATAGLPVAEPFPGSTHHPSRYRHLTAPGKRLPVFVAFLDPSPNRRGTASFPSPVPRSLSLVCLRPKRLLLVRQISRPRVHRPSSRSTNWESLFFLFFLPFRPLAHFDVVHRTPRRGGKCILHSGRLARVRSTVKPRPHRSYTPHRGDRKLPEAT